MKTLNLEQLIEVRGGSCFEALWNYFLEPSMETLLEVLEEC